MPSTYAYRVRDRSGKLIEGTLEANSTAVVADKLREMGFLPIAIDKHQDKVIGREFHLPGMAGRVKPKEVATFSRLFATMINSGLTLMRSLEILTVQTDNKVLAGIIDDVRKDLEGGSSLSQALAKHPKTFNHLYVAMVLAGETGGVLDSVLLQLSTTMEKQVELRRKIKSAMTYPLAVLSLVSLILAAMLLFIVPMFKKIYGTLGGKLPLPTTVLITVSSWSIKLAPVIILVLVVGTFLFKRWLRTDTGRDLFDAFKLKLPIFGGLVHKTALARFSRTLAVLMHAGVPILQSLEITSDTVGNAVVARGVKDVQAGVKTGEPLAERLEKHAVFPPMVVQMIAVGEETGALDNLLGKVANFYDEEVEATVAALTSLLEPLLIVVLGGSVGTMVIALYMPMFNVIKLIK